MKRGISNKISLYIREIVFGLEDSLVSTLGAVTGIAIGTGSSQITILSSVVLIAVEAISMAAGSYLSSKSAQEVFDIRQKQDNSRILQEHINDDESLYDALKKKKFSSKQIDQVVDAFGRERKLWMKEVRRSEYRLAPGVSNSVIFAGVVMGSFYLIGGAFVLLPYLIFPLEIAIYYALIATGIALFLLGSIKAKILSGHWLKSGIEMTTVALTAALFGFVIGCLLSNSFGLTV